MKKWNFNNEKVIICNLRGECQSFEIGEYVITNNSYIFQNGISTVTILDNSRLGVFIVHSSSLSTLSFLNSFSKCDDPRCIHPSKILVTDQYFVKAREDIILICFNSNGVDCIQFERGYYEFHDFSSFVFSSFEPVLAIPFGLVFFAYNKEGRIFFIAQEGTNIIPKNIIKQIKSFQISEIGDSIRLLEWASSIETKEKLILKSEWILKIDSLITPKSFDVSLILQFSVNRLDRFECILKRWKGPISVVIYLINPWDIYTFWSYYHKDKGKKFENVTFTLYKPDYRINFEDYPINKLRNIGIEASLTDYILVIDADFCPDSKLYETIVQSTLVELKMDEKKAFVIACFAILESYQGQLPDSMEELKSLYDNKVAYVTSLKGHGPTKYGIFFDSPIHGSLFYEVCFMSQWEPYYVLSRHSPFYDEKFTNQGGDKQQHAIKLNAEGYRFFVIRNHFIVHLDHFSSFKWPGGGLRSGKERKYSLFDDFLPEMQKNYSYFHRLPKCKAFWSVDLV